MYILNIYIYISYGSHPWQASSRPEPEPDASLGALLRSLSKERTPRWAELEIELAAQQVHYTSISIYVYIYVYIYSYMRISRVNPEITSSPKQKKGRGHGARCAIHHLEARVSQAAPEEESA